MLSAKNSWQTSFPFRFSPSFSSSAAPVHPADFLHQLVLLLYQVLLRFPQLPILNSPLHQPQPDLPLFPQSQIALALLCFPTPLRFN